MDLAIIMILAFLTLGIRQVSKDLSGNTLHRPGWTLSPTFGRAFFIASTWWLRPALMMPGRSKRNSLVFRLRQIEVTISIILLGMTSVSLIIWAALTISRNLVGGIYFQIPVAIVLATVAGPIAWPIVSSIVGLICLPLSMLTNLASSIETSISLRN